jgi:hypothetical protein
MRPGMPGVTVDAMRAVMSIAAVSLLAACAATEGPLLRAAPAADGGAAPAGNGAGDGAADGGASAAAPRIVPGMSFQYQLIGQVDVDVDAELFVVDLFNVSASVIAALHARGRVVACYLSAGTRESYRDDADRFPDSAVGETHAAYPDEAWLDVRDPTVRELMAARLDLARDKGFDGVLPTNLTAYRASSGFDLSAADQLDYTQWLAAEARERGLTPGMSGDYAQVEQLVDDFDWAMHFGCIARGDCADLAPFVQRGKPVFDLEYEGDIDALCAQAALEDMNVILKRESLDAFREACP